MIFIIGSLVRQFLTFIFAKCGWDKNIYTVIYLWLIITSLISGVIFLIMSIVSIWDDVKTNTLNYKFGWSYLPFIGIVYSVIMLVLFGIFVFDYIMYRKGRSAAVGFREPLTSDK